MMPAIRAYPAPGSPKEKLGGVFAVHDLAHDGRRAKNLYGGPIKIDHDDRLSYRIPPTRNRALE
jgi:hypothetical protein